MNPCGSGQIGVTSGTVSPGVKVAGAAAAVVAGTTGELADFVASAASCETVRTSCLSPAVAPLSGCPGVPDDESGAAVPPGPAEVGGSGEGFG